MTERVKMIGPGGLEDIAMCGVDQIAEWQGYGYVPETVLVAQAEEAAKAEEARLKAEVDAKAAEEAAKAQPTAKGAKG
jgi:hypothetical protein